MSYDFVDDVWESEWLTHRYYVEVVSEIIHQSWAIDEMNAGVSLEQIEDLIWKDYPAWAEKFLLDRKEQIELNKE